MTLEQLNKIAQQIKTTAAQERQKNITAATLMEGVAIGVDTVMQEASKLLQLEKAEQDEKSKSNKPKLQKNPAK